MQVALSALYVHCVCTECALHTHCVRAVHPLCTGFFERGWLEGRRAQRHMYYTRWEVATFTDSGCHPSVLLLGSIDTTATPLPTQSTAPLLTGGTEGVLVLLVASRYGLEPLPMLHAALCVITRMATAPAAQLVLLSAEHDTGAPRHTPCHAPHAGLLGLARCARQEVPLLRLSVLHAADPRAALRDLSAWSSDTEPEVALRTAPPRAQVPRLAPLPLARRGRLQLRLPARGAISNLKLEAQPTPSASLADSEIELQARTPARPHRVINDPRRASHPLPSTPLTHTQTHN